MEANLRPLTLGEILDRTAQLYRSHFLLFAGIFAFYCGVALVLNLLVIGMGIVLKGWHYSATKIAVINIAVAGVEVLILFLLLGAAVAAVSRAVAWVNLGVPATIRNAYAHVLPRLGRYLWLMTITALIVWVPIALLYGAFAGVIAVYARGVAQAHHAGAAAGQGISSNPQAMAVLAVTSAIFVLLLIPAVVYTIMMGLRFALALPSCVIEDIEARPAIRRGIELSKGTRGRIFVLWLLIAIIKTGLVLFTQLFFIVSIVKQHGQVSPVMNVISQIIAFFTNTCLGPMYAVGITLFYYDQRVRKEGYDIEWMMQAAGLTPAEPPSRPVTNLEAVAPREPETAHE